MGEGRSEESRGLPCVLGRRREAGVAPGQRELVSVASEEEERGEEERRGLMEVGEERGGGRREVGERERGGRKGGGNARGRK